MPPTSSVIPQMTAIDEERDARPRDHDDAADDEQDPGDDGPRARTAASTARDHLDQPVEDEERADDDRDRRGAGRDVEEHHDAEDQEDEADDEDHPPHPGHLADGVLQCRIFTIDAHGLPLRRRERTGVGCRRAETRGGPGRASYAVGVQS